MALMTVERQSQGKYGKNANFLTYDHNGQSKSTNIDHHPSQLRPVLTLSFNQKYRSKSVIVD